MPRIVKIIVIFRVLSKVRVFNQANLPSSGRGCSLASVKKLSQDPTLSIGLWHRLDIEGRHFLAASALKKRLLNPGPAERVPCRLFFKRVMEYATCRTFLKPFSGRKFSIPIFGFLRDPPPWRGYPHPFGRVPAVPPPSWVLKISLILWVPYRSPRGGPSGELSGPSEEGLSSKAFLKADPNFGLGQPRPDGGGAAFFQTPDPLLPRGPLRKALLVCVWGGGVE